MNEECQWCGSENVLFIETPNSIHYGRKDCKDCGKWCSWVRNPELPENNRKSKFTPEQVCELHKIKGEPICFFCLRIKEQLGNKETLTIDHIQELNEGGEDIIENTQVLCSACHKLKNWSRLYINWHLNGNKKDTNGDSETASNS